MLKFIKCLKIRYKEIINERITHPTEIQNPSNNNVSIHSSSQTYGQIMYFYKYFIIIFDFYFYHIK